MDKIMALVPTSNNQIIAVPIKSIQTNSANKIQFTSTASSIVPIQAAPNTLTSIATSIATSSTIALPTSLKPIAGLKSLPTSLKVASNVLTAAQLKKGDHHASIPEIEMKSGATYLICPKNNLLNETRIKEESHTEQLISPIQISSTASTPLVNHIGQIIQPVNQIIISQPNLLQSNLLQPNLLLQPANATGNQLIQIQTTHLPAGKQLVTGTPLNAAQTQPASQSISPSVQSNPIRPANQSSLLNPANQSSLLNPANQRNPPNSSNQANAPNPSNQANSTTNPIDQSTKQSIESEHPSAEQMEVEVQRRTAPTTLEPITEQPGEEGKETVEMDVEQSNQSKEDDSNKSQESNQLNEELAAKDEYLDDYELLDSAEGELNPIDCLIWENDIGVLPGSSLQFKLNEYDCLELVSEEEAEEIRRNARLLYEESQYLDAAYLSNGAKSDDLYSVCSTCRVRKLKSSFIRKGRFCSQECATLQSSQLRNFKKSNILDGQLPERFGRELNSKLSLGNYPYKKQLRSRKALDGFDQTGYYANGGYDEPANECRTKVREHYNQEKYFVWKKYLVETRSNAAPLKCFKASQMYNDSIKNLFKVGMKLEAIDPNHPSLFCVASVVEVCGFRLRIHLDKYSSQFDFWVNCDSPFIFPVGFCASTDRKLQPPKNYDQFDWPSYLAAEKAKAAPKHCFHSRPSELPAGFRKGMKLEAVDKANSSLVCVATINDVLGEWLLIHFDGWTNEYDYWTRYNSPHIHSTNWCKSKGKALTPPKDYPKSSEKFNWLDYLEETNSTCVPASSFRARPTNLFKPGMKLEVVDPLNARYIRVATIVARNAYSIKINFDNWDEKFDFWISDNSPDLHPINYCYHTGHYLEEPPSYDYDSLSYYNRCPIFGCKGLGHVRNPNQTEHVSIEDCPYSEENMNYEVPDRFGDASDLSSENYYAENCSANEDESNVMLSNVPSPNSDSISLSTVHKLTSNLNYANRVAGKPQPYNSYTLECFDNYYSDCGSERLSRSSSPNSDLNMLPIRQSIMDIKTSFLQLDEPLMHWDKNTKHLLSYVDTFRAEEVLEWDCERVREFIATLPGCPEYADAFSREHVDGEALLLLTQTDLNKILNIKLGPSVKIYNVICQLRKNLLK